MSAKGHSTHARNRFPQDQQHGRSHSEQEGPARDPRQPNRPDQADAKKSRSSRRGKDIPRFIEYITRHQPDYWWDYMQEHGKTSGHSKNRERRCR